jgi:hypothetical protein
MRGILKESRSVLSGDMVLFITPFSVHVKPIIRSHFPFHNPFPWLDHSSKIQGRIRSQLWYVWVLTIHFMNVLTIADNHFSTNRDYGLVCWTCK